MTEIKYTVGKWKQSLFKPCWHHGLGTPTIGDLSVADVLQVGHRVVVANFGAGLELLQPLRRLPRRQFGARLGRDAAWQRISHSNGGCKPSTFFERVQVVQIFVAS